MRLDLYASDEPRFRKPRQGVCGLCGDRVIEHPTLRHRVWAFLTILIHHH